MIDLIIQITSIMTKNQILENDLCRMGCKIWLIQSYGYIQKQPSEVFTKKRYS